VKNIVLIISTLQECDAFFSFASGLKDKNKNLNIIASIKRNNFSNNSTAQLIIDDAIFA